MIENELLNALFEMNIVLATLTLLYFLLFRKLTFHSLNRTVILLSVTTAVAVGSINYEEVKEVCIALTQLPTSDALEEEMIYSPTNQTEILHSETVFTLENATFILSTIWLIGAAVSLTMFLISLISLKAKIRNAKSISKRTYSVEGINSAFSFFGKVYLPEHYLALPEFQLNMVRQHEEKHLGLYHSIDAIFMEITAVVFWFNPLYYWLKKELKRVHEFQVDAHFKSEHNGHQYANLLLALAQPESLPIYTQTFSMTNIGMRIRRIASGKSSAIHRLRYVFLIPVLASFSYAFSYSEKTNYFFEGEPEEAVKKAFVLQMPIAKEALTQMNPYNDKRGANPQPGRHHKGVDFVAPMGTPIYSAYDGVVTLSKNEGNGYGLRVIIEHEHGMTTSYSHLQKSLVKVGQEVKAGENIGLCGSTGRSTGPHLHFEVQRNDTTLDPKQFFVGELKGVVVRKEPITDNPFTVVIDAGHGGEDPGAQGHGLDEKAINLELALLMKSMLEKENVKVVLTRTDDKYFDLKSRTDEVAKVKNGVFVSLHASSGNIENQGVKIYIPKIEDERMLNSQKLAELMRINISQSGLEAQTLQHANYFVLKYSTLPAVLFEIGNLDNEQDAINLTSADYLKQMAENLTKSILSYNL